MAVARPESRISRTAWQRRRSTGGHAPAPRLRPARGSRAAGRRHRRPARRGRRDFSGVASVSSRTLCRIPLLVTTKRIGGWFIHSPIPRVSLSAVVARIILRGARSRPGLLRAGLLRPVIDGGHPPPGPQRPRSRLGRPGNSSPRVQPGAGEQAARNPRGRSAARNPAVAGPGRRAAGIPNLPYAVAAAEEYRCHAPAPRLRPARGGRAAGRKRRPARRGRRDFSGLASVSSRTLCHIPLLVTTKRIGGWFIHSPVITPRIPLLFRDLPSDMCPHLPSRRVPRPRPGALCRGIIGGPRNVERSGTLGSRDQAVPVHATKASPRRCSASGDPATARGRS